MELNRNCQANCRLKPTFSLLVNVEAAAFFILVSDDLKCGFWLHKS